jgi:ribosome-binding protein aMBF1 (putative translation factor)
MTPETLASTIGLSIDQLKSIENNKATPTRDLLAEMEAKLDTEFVIY